MSSTIERVISNYSVGVPTRITATKVGLTNRNWIIETKTGKYFLRNRHTSFTPASIDFELGIVKHLLQAGFPTPSLIRTTGGASKVEVAGTNWELYEFIDGEKFQAEKLEQTRTAGGLLARFHRTVARLTSFRRIASGSKRPVYAVEKAKVHLPRAFGFARRFGMGNALTLEDRVSWKPSFMADVRFPTNRQRTIVHGDFSPFNLIFRGSKAIAVCDFGSSRFFHRSYDIAVAILQFGLLSNDYRGEIDRRPYLALDRVREFVEAYQAEFPLNVGQLEEVLALVPAVVRADLVEIVLGDYRMSDKMNWLVLSPSFHHWLRNSSTLLAQVLKR